MIKVNSAFILIYLIALIVVGVLLEKAVIRCVLNWEKWKQRSIKRADCLLQIIGQLVTDKSLSFSQKQDLLKNPACEYKFYSNLLRTLLNSSQELGSGYVSQLKDIREALKIDKKNEVKFQQLYFEGMTQFLLVSILGWFFVFFIGSNFNVDIHPKIVLSKSTIDCFSFALFAFLFKKSTAYFLGNHGELLEFIYSFSSQFRAGLPLNEIVLRTKANDLKFDGFSNKFILPIREMIKNYSLKGISPMDSLMQMLEEHQFLFELNFEKLNKRINVLRMSIIIVFLIPSFFFFNLSLLLTSLNSPF